MLAAGWLALSAAAWPLSEAQGLARSGGCVSPPVRRRMPDDRHSGADWMQGRRSLVSAARVWACRVHRHRPERAAGALPAGRDAVRHRPPGRHRASASSSCAGAARWLRPESRMFVAAIAGSEKAPAAQPVRPPASSARCCGRRSAPCAPIIHIGSIRRQPPRLRKRARQSRMTRSCPPAPPAPLAADHPGF